MPRWTQHDLDAHIRRRTATKLERRPGDVPVAASPAQETHPGRRQISVVSRRVRLLDEDNLCEKYHVDALRYAGVIPDDRPQDVSIHVTQERVASYAEEETVITILTP
jgi:hypothetical protein